MRDTRESRLLLVLLVCISFALVTVDMRSGENSPLDGARQAAADIFGPVEQAVAAAVNPVANAIAAVRDSGERHDRISELEQENAELRLRLNSEQQDDARADEVEELLDTAGAGQYTIVGAQVVAIGASQGFSWTATIDVGREDGVESDMTVLNGDGLVGRTTTVGESTATVLLACDPSFTVGTRLEDTNEVGFATGQGENTLEVELLNHQADVDEGDRMVTYGSQDDTPFVPGVPVGEVVSVDRTADDLTRTVQVRPYVAYTQLDVVGVVVEGPEDNPRDSVLPDRSEDETSGSGGDAEEEQDTGQDQTDADRTRSRS